MKIRNKSAPSNGLFYYPLRILATGKVSRSLPPDCKMERERFLDDFFKEFNVRSVETTLLSIALQAKVISHLGIVVSRSHLRVDKVRVWAGKNDIPWNRIPDRIAFKNLRVFTTCLSAAKSA